MTTILKNANIYQGGTVVARDVTVETPGNITVSDINSGSATSGQAIVANGSGGATWTLPACLALTGGTLTGDLTISEATVSNYKAQTTNHTSVIELSDTLNRMALKYDGNPWILFNGSEVRTTAYPFNFTGIPIYGNGDSSTMGVGAVTPASAILSVTSTTLGFLPPRMTNTQRDAIATPAEGLTIYSTTDHALEFYNGTTWKQVATV